jgi:acyl transferase domain-containing protein
MKPDCTQTGLEIAIIGMAGRFSGSPDLSHFWQSLLRGAEGISFFSDEELLSSGVSTEEFSRPNYVKAAGILNDCELFDREFFGFTPKEAELIDPQHRMFLECAWEAFEDAGYVPDDFSGLVGVFAGAAISTYFLNYILPNLDSTCALGTFVASLSNDRDYLPTRTSYKLNLRGPSVAVGTACSTSLVATHLACKALLAGECDMALAGAAAVHFPIKAGYLFHEGGIVSPDGHCRTFDAQARGTVCGSGVGAVVLKRLAEAVADRDHIYAVIKGSAVNNDGNRKVGFTAPSVNGQAEAIRLAHFMADVDPDTISYIEAHGTGTPIGDPIEVQALTQAFRTVTSRKQFCAIGSVKTNLGHTLEAAGLAGLIKTALSLKHRKLPASLHLSRPSPKLDLESTPFYVNDKLREWPNTNGPRRAGVSSFGIGGTNAHAILEEAPDISGGPSLRDRYLLTLSARSAAALDQTAERLCDYLDEHRDVNIADVAYTCHFGRKAFHHRRVVVCKDVEEAVRGLRGQNSNNVFSNNESTTATEPRVVWMFPGFCDGLGNVAAELYQVEKVFRMEADSCFEFLRRDAQVDIGSFEQSTHAVYADVLMFVAEFALAKLWMHWGVRPRAVVGHSIGEFVAACLAGVFSLEDALKIMVTRGKLIQSLPVESMMNRISIVLTESMRHFPTHPPQIPYLSCVTGNWITPEEACDPKYWGEHLRRPLGFADLIERLCDGEPQVFLEVGIGQTLCELIHGHSVRKKCGRSVVLPSLPSSDQKESAISVLLSSLGRLWLEGWSPSWHSFHRDEQRVRLSLPTYPFERDLCRVPSTPTNRPVHSPSQDVSPKVELHRRITELWRELLGIEKIGTDSDFFDLGGDSLLATQLFSRLSDMFPVDLPLDKFYDKPTIAHLVRIVESLLCRKLEEIPDLAAASMVSENPTS